MGATGGIGTWYSLSPGTSAEWAFRYLGNNDRALIAFGVNPVGAIAINVYDDGQWRSLGSGDTSVTPVGKGTAGTVINWDAYKDVISNGNLFWEAKARPRVTFHIQIINTSKQEAQYWIAKAGPAAGSLSSVSIVNPVQASQSEQPAVTPQTAQGSAAEAPLTLSEAGGSEAPMVSGAGMTSPAGGWLIRHRNN